MVNRIQEILQKYGLTASRFADQLEVPRSTISHILSERNKPSLEFIQKVLDNYPEINVNWLVKGEGNIFGVQRDLFSDLSEIIETSDPSQNEKEDYPSREEIIKGKDTDEKKYENLSEVTSVPNTPKKLDIETVNEPQKKETGSKKLVKLIMIYDNHSFEEYFPAG